MNDRAMYTTADATPQSPPANPVLTDDGGAPLSGLFTGRPAFRKRAYAAYAGVALIVSFAPDVVAVGLLTGDQSAGLVAVATLASSVLLKVGVAFGFIAASNVGS